MQVQNNADIKKQEREQVVELGSDLTKSDKGNIYTLTSGLPMGNLREILMPLQKLLRPAMDIKSWIQRQCYNVHILPQILGAFASR